MSPGTPLLLRRLTHLMTSSYHLTSHHKSGSFFPQGSGTFPVGFLPVIWKVEKEGHLPTEKGPIMEKHTQQTVGALAPERQFDFWLGEWNLTWDGGRGSNSIQAILDGKVILESFDAGSPETFKGMSVSVYNSTLGKWQQTWVDNTGNYLDFVGGVSDGKMILERTVRQEEEIVMQRMVFYRINQMQLDWNWERSVDQGANWELLWHIHYQRKAENEHQHVESRSEASA